MFEIANFQPVKGKSCNIRAENHGSEHVICMDWAVTMDVPNTWLDNLDKALLPMFYKAIDEEHKMAAQETLDGIDIVSALPLLRSSNLKFPLALNHEFVGYQLTVDHGLGGKSNLVLLEVKVNKFAIDCKEGGTVTVSCRIQAQRVSEEVRGYLSSFIKGAETKIALKAPQERQAPIDGTKGHPGAAAAQQEAKKPEKVQEAGDAFAAAHAPAKTTKGGKTGRPEPKYRNGATGETWSGRGLQPAWVKLALKNGATLEQFEIEHAGAPA